jgi:hypothetical protein
MPKQPKQLSMQTLLDVIKALEIDVPIMRCEEDPTTGSVTVYLYGGEVKHWPPTAQAEIVGAQGLRPGDAQGLRPGADPNPMPHFTPPPVTRSQLTKSQRAKKSQTKST